MAKRFALGRVLATPGVLARVPQLEILVALSRHMNGDWGDLDKEDKDANDWAVGNGARLLSNFESLGEVPFWIVTEGNRSTTTVLLPDEY